MRRSEGLFWEQDFSVIRLNGEGTRTFLNGQTTGDLSSAKEGVFYNSCWLTATGRLKALLEIRFDSSGADVLILSGDSNELGNSFERVIFPADKVTLRSLRNTRRVQFLSSKPDERFKGVCWLSMNERIPIEFDSFSKAKPEEFEYWRLEYGLPIGPGELKVDANPFELGLSDLVNLEKGCYLGQETMAKLARSGGGKQQLRFWQAEGNVSVGQRLVLETVSQTEAKSVGFITSVLKIANRDISVGLALVRRHAYLEEDLILVEDSRKVKITTPFGFIPPPNC